MRVSASLGWFEGPPYYHVILVQESHRLDVLKCAQSLSIIHIQQHHLITLQIHRHLFT